MLTDGVGHVLAVQVHVLQALVAIKCLDEGVNIPNIHTAFILASSTNPKEYIQRRGRVLRKAPGKDYAVIYDFVTLPFPIDEIEMQSEAVILASLTQDQSGVFQTHRPHFLLL